MSWSEKKRDLITKFSNRSRSRRGQLNALGEWKDGGERSREADRGVNGLKRWLCFFQHGAEDLHLGWQLCIGWLLWGGFIISQSSVYALLLLFKRRGSRRHFRAIDYVIEWKHTFFTPSTGWLWKLHLAIKLLLSRLLAYAMSFC